MAETIGDIQVVAYINTKDYDAGKKHIEKGNNELEGNAKKTSSSFSAAWAGAIGGLVATVAQKGFAAISNSIDSAVKRVDTLNNSTRTFENMGIAGTDSKKAMDALVKSIKGMPTPLDGAVRGMTALTATYGDIGKGQKVFSALNNAILGFGGSSAEVENAITQLSQLPMDGPLDAQTWNSLRNSGITPVLVAMAKDSGKSVSEMKEAFGEGELKVQDFIDRLIKMNEEGGGGLKSLEKIAKDSTGGIGTGFANMQTAISRGVAKVVEAIGSENISKAITVFGTAFEQALTVLADVIIWLSINVPKIVKAISDFGSSTVNNLISAWSKVSNFFIDTWTNINSGVSSFISFVGDLVTAINSSLVSAFNSVSKWLKDNYKWFETIGIIIGTVLLPLMLKLAAQAAVTGAKMIASFALTAASAVKNAAIVSAQWIASAAKSVAAWLINLPKVIAQFAVMAATATVNAIKSGAVWVAQAAVTAASWAVTFAKYIAGVALSAAQTLIAGAKMAASWMLALGPIGLIVAAVVGATALIIANWEAVSSFVGGVWANITKWAGDTWNSIKSFFGNVPGWFGSIFTSASNNIKSAFGGIIGFFKGLWDGIVSIFGSVGTSVGNAISKAFKGVIQGVLSGAINIINGFINAINGAIGAINSIPGVDIGKLGTLSVPQFAEGGFTGRGGKYEAAGVVHKGEYVVPKQYVNQTTGLPNISGGTEYNIQNINISSEVDGDRWLRRLTNNTEIESSGLVPTQRYA